MTCLTTSWFTDSRARTVVAAADLVVHHGGMGTTLAAAAYGVPQLLLPQVGDQFAKERAVNP